MTLMKGRRLGVYFSLALAILALSIWAGWKLGGRAAAYRYRFQQRKLETSSPEQSSLESTLAELGDVERLRVMAAVSTFDPKLAKKILPLEAGSMEAIRKKSANQVVQPLIDLNLGFVYVYSAIAEEQSGDEELAAKHMRSAQSIFQLLGWQDYSAETVKAAARLSLDPGSPHLQTQEAK